MDKNIKRLIKEFNRRLKVQLNEMFETICDGMKANRKHEQRLERSKLLGIKYDGALAKKHRKIFNFAYRPNGETTAKELLFRILNGNPDGLSNFDLKFQRHVYRIDKDKITLEYLENYFYLLFVQDRIGEGIRGFIVPRYFVKAAKILGFNDSEITTLFPIIINNMSLSTPYHRIGFLSSLKENHQEYIHKVMNQYYTNKGEIIPNICYAELLLYLLNSTVPPEHISSMLDSLNEVNKKAYIGEPFTLVYNEINHKLTKNLLDTSFQKLEIKKTKKNIKYSEAEFGFDFESKEKNKTPLEQFSNLIKYSYVVNGNSKMNFETFCILIEKYCEDSSYEIRANAIIQAMVMHREQHDIKDESFKAIVQYFNHDGTIKYFDKTCEIEAMQIAIEKAFSKYVRNPELINALKGLVKKNISNAHIESETYVSKYFPSEAIELYFGSNKVNI